MNLISLFIYYVKLLLFGYIIYFKNYYKKACHIVWGALLQISQCKP